MSHLCVKYCDINVVQRWETIHHLLCHFNNVSFNVYLKLFCSPFYLYLISFPSSTFLHSTITYVINPTHTHISSSMIHLLFCHNTLHPLLSIHSHSPLSLTQCDCGASAGRFIVCRLRVLGWRGGMEEVSFQTHLARCIELQF